MTNLTTKPTKESQPRSKADEKRSALPTSTPSPKAEKSARRDKENPHRKDAAQASKKDESKKKAAAAPDLAPRAKQGVDSTAPPGQPAAKGSAAAAATTLKVPSPSPPNKGKSKRDDKDQSKPPTTPLDRAISPAPSPLRHPMDPGAAITRAHVPPLTSARQSEAVPGGAGVREDDKKRKRAAEQVKEKERELAKEGGGRKKDGDARARGGRTAASQTGTPSAHVPQPEAKQALPHAPRQAPPIGAISDAPVSADANLSTSTSRKHGGRAGEMAMVMVEGHGQALPQASGRAPPIEAIQALLPSADANLSAFTSREHGRRSPMPVAIRDQLRVSTHEETTRTHSSSGWEASYTRSYEFSSHSA